MSDDTRNPELTPEQLAEASRRFQFPGGRRFHFTDPGGNELAVWSER